MIPARERIACLGQQGGEYDRADSRQGAEDRRVARIVRRSGGILVQPSAEFVKFLFGLVKLGVCQAQPGHQGAQVQDGGLGGARSVELADAVPPEQPRRLGRGRG